MVWDVEGTDEFAEWFGGLERSDKVRVEAAMEALEELGPALGRPWADSLEGTELKELIPRGGYIRILFRFDPRRTGILLLGGDKGQQWHVWYRENIPKAERLYEIYLDELRNEDLIDEDQ
jgi:hypothetical protein